MIRRSNLITVRYTASEFRLIEAKASSMGKSISNAIRELSLNNAIKSDENIQVSTSLVGKIDKKLDAIVRGIKDLKRVSQ